MVTVIYWPIVIGPNLIDGSIRTATINSHKRLKRCGLRFALIYPYVSVGVIINM